MMLFSCYQSLFLIVLYIKLFVASGLSLDFEEHSTHFVTNSCLQNVNIFGPGWDQPQLVFPSRYFFVDHASNCSKRIKFAHIESYSKTNRCLARIQLLNQTQFMNDLLIVRYRLVSDFCENFDILLYDELDKLVVKRSVKSKIYEDNCSCHYNQWNSAMQCDQHTELYQKIHDDLRLV